MKARKLLVLAAVAAALAALAYVSSSRRGRIAAPAPELGQPVLPQLQQAERLNAVREIEFASADQTLRAAHRDGRWTAPDKFGYPVDFEKVRRFLRKLADLKVGQKIPATAAERESLKLLDPAGAAGTDAAAHAGTRVRLLDSAGAEIAALLFGREHERRPAAGRQGPFGAGGYPDGRYVSVRGEVYLVDETFSDLPRNAKAWLDDDLANVSSSDIQNLRIVAADGAELEFLRPSATASLVLTDLDEDAEEMNSGKVSGISGALSWLRFNDVADPDLGDAELGFDEPTRYVATTRKGVVYTLTLGGSPEGTGDRYARLEAAFEPPADAEPAEEAQEEQPEDDAENERDAIAREVAQRNAKVSGWTYVVPSFKISDISTERADFVKAKEQEPAETPVEDVPEDDRDVEPAAETEAEKPPAEEPQDDPLPDEEPAEPEVAPQPAGEDAPEAEDEDAQHQHEDDA